MLRKQKLHAIPIFSFIHFTSEVRQNLPDVKIMYRYEQTGCVYNNYFSPRCQIACRAFLVIGYSQLVMMIEIKVGSTKSIWGSDFFLAIVYCISF